MWCKAAGSEINNWFSYESSHNKLYAASADIITYAKRAFKANDIPMLILPLEVSLCCLSLIEFFQIP
jgi:hypothetical protein